MNVTIQTLPRKRVLAVAHRGPYTTIGAAFAQLDTVLKAAPIPAADCLEMVAIYHDDAETIPAPQLRADAGLVVTDRVAAPSGLHEAVIPAGVYACTIHQGTYDRLGDAWARFTSPRLDPPASGPRSSRRKIRHSPSTGRKTTRASS